nr:hypothetical protein [Tanacetum cinerariifolium]
MDTHDVQHSDGAGR